MGTFNEDYFEPDAGDHVKMLSFDYDDSHTVERSKAISLKRLADFFYSPEVQAVMGMLGPFVSKGRPE